MLLGFNKLAGFAIPFFTIKLAPDPDGTNMVGEVYIPNPTVMTIAMVTSSLSPASLTPSR